MFRKCALRVPVVWWYSITQLLLRISPLLSLRKERERGRTGTERRGKRIGTKRGWGNGQREREKERGRW